MFTLVDGELTVSESNAILGYVSEAYGGFRPFSRDPRKWAAITSRLFRESAHGSRRSSPGFAFAAFPAITAWYGRMEELEAWQRTAVEPWK